ncbi:MAG: AMP-binding protein, partial [Candidatus Aegiribacteria sp.]|nr:AMP-binding protein [Candidatus Aegiribacteria sp.]MBD3295298.1 AMP-binding protein [Candidatus Fermentibacteria bacterium]
ALEDDSGRLTYRDWWRTSCAIAAKLYEAGVEKGYLVGVVSQRTVLLPCSFTAISMLGARFVSLNPDWPLQERECVFARWQDRMVLCAGVECDGLQEERVLTVLPDIIRSSEEPPVTPEVFPDDEIYFNVTSASTGQAKVAPTTHNQLLANTRGVCRTLGLDEEDIHISLFGVYGHPHELFMRGLFLGGRTVLTENKYPRDLLKVISEKGVTTIMGLPTQLMNLSHLWSRSDSDLSRVRMAEAGGMHIPEEFMKSFITDTGVDLVPVLGSTETSGVCLVGESGRPGFTKIVHGYKVELRDLEGGIIPGEGIGELWISGPGVVKGYLGDRPKTEESFREGWYRTGDIFRREDETLIFLGRRGGLIKAAGLKVYPLEVELAILKHPSVLDACVVGRDHPTRGEIPSAYIVNRPGQEIKVAEMRAFLREHIDEHKIPRLINFVHGLPRTANGKIDRKAVGTREIVPDHRSELLRSDVELVKLINHRAELMEMIGGGFDPTWVDEQVDNAVGHNPGPISDSSIRDIIRFVVSELGKR